MVRTMSFLLGVLLGTAFGSSLALLVAPQSGTETRSLVTSRAAELRDRARERVQVLATNAREQVRAATARFRKADEERGEAG